MHKIWKQEELEFIRQNAGIFNDAKLTQELNTHFNRNFTPAGVRKCRQRMGIIKEGHRSFFKIKSTNESVA